MSSRAPWILGARGAPLEAPENTAAGLATALARGLDGIAADARACRSGEIVVHADADLERTTDGHGRIAEKDWTELADLDAGRGFHARFRGEKLLLVEELLAVSALHGPASNLVVRIRGEDAPDVVMRFADLARELAPHASLRVAADDRDTVLAARDAGLAALVVADALDERLLEQVKIDRPSALAVPVGAWTTEIGRADWPVERWSFDVDAPEDLLRAHRANLHAYTTREPQRALAARRLFELAHEYAGAWPVEVDPVEVAPDPDSLLAGDWSGSWTPVARIANPFPFAVRVQLGLVVRRGVFDVHGLPREFELAPRATESVEFALSGGARRPGGDPLVVARCSWRKGPGRAAGSVDFDAPIARVRTALADTIPRRAFLLRDGPKETTATLVLRRRMRHLVVALESPGPLRDPRVVVRIDGRIYRGARGVRATLPPDFDTRERGVAFSCGLEAFHEGERVVRAWAGGLTDEPDAGVPGVLLGIRPGN